MSWHILCFETRRQSLAIGQSLLADPFPDLNVPEVAKEEIVRYLTSTSQCWWTARRIGVVLPHARRDIETVLEGCWLQGMLRRKRGIGGQYEYQMRVAGS